MGRFSGKVAVITGGAGGIGGATVEELCDEGAQVVFGDVAVALGEEKQSAMTARGHAATFAECHVEVESDCKALVDLAIERYGRLDVLVNNAGIRNYQRVTEAEESSWDRILGVNLKGYAFCAKYAIPAIEASGGGSIVNVASIRSIVAGAGTPQYDTTKAAILGLTRAMARDHASQGLRVNAVGPGPIFTRFHAGRAAELGLSEEQYVTQFGADTLLKRPGTPLEVARAIAFLASDDASFITGTCLFVDGGLTAFGEGR